MIMDIKTVKAVMKKYGKAWENQDSALILECFTKNSKYQESPLAKPYVGHEKIKGFWDNEVCKKQKNIKFTVKKCHVSKDGKTGFSEWDCWLTEKGIKYHQVGIMILIMKGSKIEYLNEYWMNVTV